MQIEKNIRQFNDQPALLMATGNKHAKIYLAADGQISELEEIRVAVPKYSDREGFFSKSAKGFELGSGSVYEEKKDYVISSFLKEINKKMKDLTKKHRFLELYLFAPDYMAKQVEEACPAGSRKVLKGVIHGNYVDEHPFKLLKLIEKEINKRTGEKVPRKKEAKKIIDKPRV